MKGDYFMNNTLCAAETANNGTDNLTSFESFKARFFEDLKDKLPGVELSIREVKKLNESYEGIAASPVGSNVEFPKVKDTTSIPRGLLLNRYSRRAG